MPRTLVPLAEEWMADLPPYYEEDEPTKGVLNALASEFGAINTAGLTIQSQVFPQNADDTYSMLGLWESLVGLPVAAAGQSVAARRARVMGHLRRRRLASGAAWEDAITEVIGSGWSVAENTPGAYTLQVTIPYQGGMAAPTALTPVATSGGGTLPAGTYYYKVTALDSYGETTGSVEASATLGATGHINLTWSSPPATGFNVYRSSTSGTEHLLASTASASYSDTGANTPSSVSVPVINTTGSFEYGLALGFLRDITPAHIEVTVVHGTGFIVGVSQVGDESIV